MQRDEIEQLKVYNQPKVYEIGLTRALQLRPPAGTTRFPWPVLPLAAAAVGFVLFVLRVSRGHIFAGRWTPKLLLYHVLGGLVLGGWIWRQMTAEPTSEPTAWLEGVSIWPTLLLRAFILVLSSFFIFNGAFVIGENNRELQKKFAGARPTRRPPGQAKTPDPWSAPAEDVRKGRVSAERLWAGYQRAGTVRGRTGRVLAMLGALIVVFTCLGLLFGDRSLFPADRHLAPLFYTIMGVSAMVYVIMSLFVLDATILCGRFVARLSGGNTEWPVATTERTIKKRRLRGRMLRDVDFSSRLAREWLDVEVIARRTRVIGRLIIYPFAVLALIIVSRMDYFEGWQVMPALLVIYVTYCALAVTCAVLLRQCTEKARQRTIDRLRASRMSALAQGNADRAKVTESLISDITALREGAFAPISQNPIVGALLMPVSGIGVLALLDLFSI